ncbi:ATP-binding protein [Acidithiobacillus ferriphilus]|uniref:AAA family ATPase n=1 Tax=Acidithiobacillus ferriphilus TaxID=1689834 RepID=UPI001C05FA67|nr:AAA family ATPase [Acidithiobacillus ferriphilus]MBU2786196.1 ATP-binding protein [Acidithiobacillus ferriphilus]UEP59884.1 ATP-binding protein [Acidithiobacillus ferriphilus]
MAVSQQRLLALQIDRLKGLSNVRIDFDARVLTAIMGPNGFGKSTVLHALAVAFRQTQAGLEELRFTDFFPNTPQGIWSGTSYVVVHRFREGEKVSTVSTLCKKDTGQWQPLPKRKPKRDVFYIGVDTAVPRIELYPTRRKVSFQTHVLTDAKSEEVRQKAAYIFNKPYSEYHRNEISSRRNLIGVKSDGVAYSALSMGAGEQRVFNILQVVAGAGKYALILIDEIDLLLHTEALHRFLETLRTYADDKQLQIIFTTHRESVLRFEGHIAVRHLFQSSAIPGQTFCFNETKPDAITRLTGEPQRQLAISCEDDVARAIIEKVVEGKNLRPYVEFTQFGSNENSFTLIAALILARKEITNSVFVLDGDKYQTKAERVTRFKKVLTGDEPWADERRELAASYLIQMLPSAGECPELYLHTLIKSVQPTGDQELDAVIQAAHSVGAVMDNHHYIDLMIEKLGYGREVGLSKVVAVAAKAEGWPHYTSEIRTWLEARASALLEQPAALAVQ